MGDVSIRDMREEDCAAVSDMVCASFREAAIHNGFAEDEIKAYFVNRGAEQAIRDQFREYRCWVACSAGTIIAMVAVKGNEITKLYVAPNHSRRGIGARLFRAAEKVIADSGHSELVVCAHFDSTIAFYEAMGMSTVGRRSTVLGRVPGRDPMILRKVLTKNP